jgi:hypothetical protein
MGQVTEHKGDRRRDQVLRPDPEAGRQRLIAGRRKPAEPDGENHNDDDRPEEFRHRDAEVSRNRDAVVERAAVPERRDDAEADPDHGDQHERDGGQHQ